MSSVECGFGGEPSDPTDGIRLQHAILYDAISRRLDANADATSYVPRPDGSISEVFCGIIQFVPSNSDETIDATVTLERRSAGTYHSGFLAAEILYEYKGENRQEEVAITREPVDPTYAGADYENLLNKLTPVVEKVKPYDGQSEMYAQLLTSLDKCYKRVVEDGQSTSSRLNVRYWHAMPSGGDETAA